MDFLFFEGDMMMPFVRGREGVRIVCSRLDLLG